MLAVCRCESAQDIEKAGHTCWNCGEDLRDARVTFVSTDAHRDYGDRFDSIPRTNPLLAS